jgi:hypothetical protein
MAQLDAIGPKSNKTQQQVINLDEVIATHGLNLELMEQLSLSHCDHLQQIKSRGNCLQVQPRSRHHSEVKRQTNRRSSARAIRTEQKNSSNGEADIEVTDFEALHGKRILLNESGKRNSSSLRQGKIEVN